MLVNMNAIYEHPSLKMQVTPEQRDRAESWLKEAYADGRIGESEFDQRIGQVLTAVSRKELNEAFYGLVQIPTPSRALGVHPAYQPLVRPETRQQAGRGVAAVLFTPTARNASNVTVQPLNGSRRCEFRRHGPMFGSVPRRTAIYR